MFKELILASSIGSAVIGGTLVVEDRFAKGWEVAELDNRLEQKIVSDELYTTQQHLWRVEDKLELDPDNSDLRQQSRELEYRHRDLRDALKKLNAYGSVGNE